jgi:hypothetical protein
MPPFSGDASAPARGCAAAATTRAREDEYEDPGPGQTRHPEVHREQQRTEQRPDERPDLTRDGEQREHAGAGSPARLLPLDRLPRHLRLHGRREQRGGEPDEQYGPDDAPGLFGVPEPAEPGDPQHAPREHHGPYAVPVGERPADHEQPLLAEGPQPQHEPNQPARHADRLRQVLGEERQDGEEADVEGELGEDQQPEQRVRAGSARGPRRSPGGQLPSPLAPCMLPAAVTASAPSRASTAAGARTAQGARSA